MKLIYLIALSYFVFSGLYWLILFNLLYHYAFESVTLYFGIVDKSRESHEFSITHLWVNFVEYHFVPSSLHLLFCLGIISLWLLFCYFVAATIQVVWKNLEHCSKGVCCFSLAFRKGCQWVLNERKLLLFKDTFILQVKSKLILLIHIESIEIKIWLSLYKNVNGNNDSFFG